MLPFQTYQQNSYPALNLIQEYQPTNNKIFAVPQYQIPQINPNYKKYIQNVNLMQRKESKLDFQARKAPPSWTKEEEKLLEVKFEEIGPHWSKMASFFPNRTDVNLKNHWSAMLNRKSREEVKKKIKSKQNKKETGAQENGDIFNIDLQFDKQVDFPLFPQFDKLIMENL